MKLQILSILLSAPSFAEVGLHQSIKDPSSVKKVHLEIEKFVATKENGGFRGHLTGPFIEVVLDNGHFKSNSDKIFNAEYFINQEELSLKNDLFETYYANQFPISKEWADGLIIKDTIISWEKFEASLIGKYIHYYKDDTNLIFKNYQFFCGGDSDNFIQNCLQKSNFTGRDGSHFTINYSRDTDEGTKDSTISGKDIGIESLKDRGDSYFLASELGFKSEKLNIESRQLKLRCSSLYHSKTISKLVLQEKCLHNAILSGQEHNAPIQINVQSTQQNIDSGIEETLDSDISFTKASLYALNKKSHLHFDNLLYNDESYNVAIDRLGLTCNELKKFESIKLDNIADNCLNNGIANISTINFRDKELLRTTKIELDDIVFSENSFNLQAKKIHQVSDAKDGLNILINNLNMNCKRTGKDQSVQISDLREGCFERANITVKDIKMIEKKNKTEVLIDKIKLNKNSFYLSVPKAIFKNDKGNKTTLKNFKFNCFPNVSFKDMEDFDYKVILEKCISKLKIELGNVKESGSILQLAGFNFSRNINLEAKPAKDKTKNGTFSLKMKGKTLFIDKKLEAFGDISYNKKANIIRLDIKKVTFLPLIPSTKLILIIVDLFDSLLEGVKVKGRSIYINLNKIMKE